MFIGNGPNQTIDVYAPGATVPFKTFTGCLQPGPFAVDPQDRVWVNCNPGLYYIEPGTLQMEKSKVATGIVSGISFDKAGTMYITVPEANPCVYVFPPGKTRPSKRFGKNLTQCSDSVVAVGDNFFLATNVGPVYAFHLSDYRRYAQFTISEPLGLAAWPLVGN